MNISLPHCASDYPHEIISGEHCRHEPNELLERDDLTKADKESAVGANAARLYRLAA